MYIVCTYGYSSPLCFRQGCSRIPQWLFAYALTPLPLPLPQVKSLHLPLSCMCYHTPVFLGMVHLQRLLEPQFAVRYKLLYNVALPCISTVYSSLFSIGAKFSQTAQLICFDDFNPQKNQELIASKIKRYTV